mmetsp:Transcript_9288/g.30887  ORF Transcript_9288/g.30887 Transcript_9288/m.30887 type:complete len:322 (-) Transcript_9288:435-1400(-)
MRRAFWRTSRSSLVRSCNNTAVSTRVNSNTNRKNETEFLPLVFVSVNPSAAPDSKSKQSQLGPTKSHAAAHRSRATCLSSLGAFARNTEETPPRKSWSQFGMSVISVGVSSSLSVPLFAFPKFPNRFGRAAFASAAVSFPKGARAGRADRSKDKHLNASICVGCPGEQANVLANAGSARAAALAVLACFLSSADFSSLFFFRPLSASPNSRSPVASVTPCPPPSSLSLPCPHTPRIAFGDSRSIASRRMAPRRGRFRSGSASFAFSVSVGAISAAAFSIATAAAARTPDSAAFPAALSPPAATTLVAASHASATADDGRDA